MLISIPWILFLLGIKALRVTKYGDVICQKAYELLMSFWNIYTVCICTCTHLLQEYEYFFTISSTWLTINKFPTQPGDKSDIVWRYSGFTSYCKIVIATITPDEDTRLECQNVVQWIVTF